MTKQDERLETVKAFLNREDLEGTELKLKNKVLVLDQKLSQAQADSQRINENFKQIQQAANNKQLEVVGLAERLDSLCDLILEVSSEDETEVEE